VPSEDEIAFGLHLHLLAPLGESRWAIGAGFEHIFDEHAHNTVAALVQYRVIDAWSVALGPGLTLGEDELSHVDPSLHVETAYEFAVGEFHLGPSFEFALDPRDVHLTLGVHMGFGF
jgi:hypothetical protein